MSIILQYGVCLQILVESSFRSSLNRVVDGKLVLIKGFYSLDDSLLGQVQDRFSIDLCLDGTPQTCVFQNSLYSLRRNFRPSLLEFFDFFSVIRHISLFSEFSL
jgi:hypothetical protein